MLQAYFDESEREQNTVLVVGGCLLLPEALPDFRDEWNALFRKFGGSHWAELTAHTPSRMGRFAHISQPERNALVDEGIEVICKYVECWATSSCLKADVASIHDNIEGYRHAYSVLCQKAILKISQIAASLGHAEGIDYFLESGYEGKHAAETDLILNHIADAKRMTGLVRASGPSQVTAMFGVTPEELADFVDGVLYRSHHFESKEQCLFLEAADAIVWEAGREAESLKNGWDGRPQFQRLGARPERCSAGVASRESIRKHLGRIKEIEDATS